MGLTTSEPDENILMNDDNPVLELMDDEEAYASDLGAMYQGDSIELLQQLPDESIDLVVTSPPFALQHQKEYGNKELGAYNDWFMEFVPEVRRVLAPHGSFVIEIGGAFKKGWPERSTYQFDLLTRIVDEGEFHLAQDFYWFNPAKLPSPIEWVNVRKIRVTDAVTHVWWLSKDINKDAANIEGEQPIPEANNQRVLQEYSDSQKQLIETGDYNAGKRPSGHDIHPDAFANDNEGSIPKNLLKEAEDLYAGLEEVSAEEFLEEITAGRDLSEISAKELMETLGHDERHPSNLIEASNTASNTHYLRMIREFEEHGFEKHPARFPRQIPEFFIQFLTPNPPYDDWDRGYLDRPVVLDIFAGSNLTGKVAETMGRNWLAFEQRPDYIETSQLRFLTEEQIRKMLSEDQTGLEEFYTADAGD